MCSEILELAVSRLLYIFYALFCTGTKQLFKETSDGIEVASRRV